MPERRYPKEEIVQRGDQLFESSIRKQVEGLPANFFVAIDIESGDFETGSDSLEVTHRLLARHPEAQIFMRRVGFRWTIRLGGGPRITNQGRPQ